MYSCLSKGAGWDPIHPPAVPKSDHAAVVAIINGERFLCEPTWGAGAECDGKWGFDYNPVRFLLPLVRTLNDHFPLDGSEKYLEDTFPYERFLRVAQHRPNSFDFRNESHPFARFDCKKGYLKMRFSTSHEAKELHASVCEVGKKRKECERHLNAIELIRATKDRQCFWLHVVFPRVALYHIRIFVNTREQTEIYVDSKKECTEVPFLSYTVGNSGFAPISPMVGLTHADSGFAIIRFAVSIGRSRLLLDVLNMQGKNHRDRANYVRLIIPSDTARCEDVVAVSFPENGRWRVWIWLENDQGSFTQFVMYEFDVSGANSQIVSPIDYVQADRKFVPLTLPPNLSVSPDSSALVLDRPETEVTATFRGTLDLNLRPIGSDSTTFPTVVAQSEIDGLLVKQFHIDIPGPGHYRMLYFLDSKYVLEQDYWYGKNKGVRAPVAIGQGTKISSGQGVRASSVADVVHSGSSDSLMTQLRPNPGASKDHRPPAEKQATKANEFPSDSSPNVSEQTVKPRNHAHQPISIADPAKVAPIDLSDAIVRRACRRLGLKAADLRYPTDTDLAAQCQDQDAQILLYYRLCRAVDGRIAEVKELVSTGCGPLSDEDEEKGEEEEGGEWQQERQEGRRNEMSKSPRLSRIQRLRRALDKRERSRQRRRFSRRCRAIERFIHREQEDAEQEKRLREMELAQRRRMERAVRLARLERQKRLRWMTKHNIHRQAARENASVRAELEFEKIRIKVLAREMRAEANVKIVEEERRRKLIEMREKLAEKQRRQWEERERQAREQQKLENQLRAKQIDVELRVRAHQAAKRQEIEARKKEIERVKLKAERSMRLWREGYADPRRRAKPDRDLKPSRLPPLRRSRSDLH
jgi:hypothetical protein